MFILISVAAELGQRKFEESPKVSFPKSVSYADFQLHNYYYYYYYYFILFLPSVAKVVLIGIIIINTIFNRTS